MAKWQRRYDDIETLIYRYFAQHALDIVPFAQQVTVTSAMREVGAGMRASRRSRTRHSCQAGRTALFAWRRTRPERDRLA
ncbi:hypothetical protein AB2N08_10740 [Massilia aurea]|uniref:hypothetical protein n=1 Tax=Massilia aurea TaxID=373040 RepID=UPI003462D7B5